MRKIGTATIFFIDRETFSVYSYTIKQEKIVAVPIFRCTLIPCRMGRFLGLERIASEIREMGGIGGVIAVRFAVIPMKIETYQFNCTIAWAQIERVPLLLGREGVFGHFDITFQQRSKKTIFVWQG